MSQNQPNLDAEINTLLPSGSDITAATLRQVLHDMNAGIFQSGVTGLAAPAAFVGLSAQTGSASTALRSDSAPALNQGIVPVWTGQHTFGSGIPSTNSITGAIVVSNPGGIGVGGNIYAGGFIATGTIGTAGQLTLNGSISGTALITISPLANTTQISGTLAVMTSTGTTSGFGFSAVVEAAQRLTGTVSGTVSTTDIPIIIPAGVSVLGIQIYVTTTFGASGTVGLTCGTAPGDNAYLTSTTINTGGTTYYNPNWNGASAGKLGAIPGPGPNFFIRLTQTGTPSGVGSCVIIVDYVGSPIN